METDDPIFVKVPQAARLTGISKSKYYESIAKGEIPAKKIGGVILVPVAWIRQQAAEAMGGTDAPVVAGRPKARELTRLR